MTFRIIKHQCLFALKQKSAVITFYILLAIALMSFTSNVFEFQGYDLIEMYHPVKLLLLSYNRAYYKGDFALMLIQLYPVLVVCPAGFMLLSEKNRNEDILLITRVASAGKSIYCPCILL